MPVDARPSAAAAAAERETARLEAFSDGVFAIAITLLILELKVPRAAIGDLRGALLARWPSCLAHLTSFGTVGVIWLNHHRIFSLMRRCDHATLVLNLGAPAYLAALTIAQLPDRRANGYSFTRHVPRSRGTAGDPG